MPRNQPPFSMADSQGKSPTMNNVDLAKAIGSNHTTNTQHPNEDIQPVYKSRNVLLSSNQNSDYLYVDTNMEQDLEEEERTYTPEPAR